MKKMLAMMVLIALVLSSTVALAADESYDFEAALEYLNREIDLPEGGIFGLKSQEDVLYFDFFVPYLQKTWFIEATEGSDGAYVWHDDLERIAKRIQDTVEAVVNERYNLEAALEYLNREVDLPEGGIFGLVSEEDNTTYFNFYVSCLSHYWFTEASEDKAGSYVKLANLKRLVERINGYLN